MTEPNSTETFEHWYERITEHRLYCVYAFWAQDGKALYVGQTNNLRTRAQTHFAHEWAKAKVHKLTILAEVASREEALRKESEQIKALQPTYNREKHHKRLSLGERYEMVERFLSKGESLHAIAEEFGVSHEKLSRIVENATGRAISKHLRTHNVELPTDAQYDDAQPDDERSHELVFEVAQRLSVSSRRIRVLCEQGRFGPGAVKVGRDWLIPRAAMPTITGSGPQPTWER